MFERVDGAAAGTCRAKAEPSTLRRCAASYFFFAPAALLPMRDSLPAIRLPMLLL
ncbi:MAG: hypothetical protein V7631_1133 [Massilia sp.]|jgi:hypothetical protein